MFPNGQPPEFRTYPLIRAIHLPSIPEADKAVQGPSFLIHYPEQAVSVSCLVVFCLVLGFREISQGKPPWQSQGKAFFARPPVCLIEGRLARACIVTSWRAQSLGSTCGMAFWRISSRMFILFEFWTSNTSYRFSNIQHEMDLTLFIERVGANVGCLDPHCFSRFIPQSGSDGTSRVGFDIVISDFSSYMGHSFGKVRNKS